MPTRGHYDEITRIEQLRLDQLTKLRLRKRWLERQAKRPDPPAVVPKKPFPD